MSGKVAFALMTVFRDTHILSSTYGILALFYATFRLDLSFHGNEVTYGPNAGDHISWSPPRG